MDIFSSTTKMSLVLISRYGKHLKKCGNEYVEMRKHYRERSVCIGNDSHSSIISMVQNESRQYPNHIFKVSERDNMRCRIVELRYTTDGRHWRQVHLYGSKEVQNVVMGTNYFIQFLAPDNNSIY